MSNRLTARPGWVLAAAVAAVALVFLVTTGVAPWPALRLVAVVSVQAVGGAVVWRMVRPRGTDAVETIGMGLAIGSVLATLGGLLTQVLGLGSWGWALPAVVAAAVWAATASRRGGPPDVEPGLDRRSVLALVVAAVLGLASLVPNLLSYPLAWTGTWGRYHADMLFFESLATSLARLGPLDSIFTPDGVVRYHWLVYAWSGQVTQAADAGPFVVLTRVLPFVTVLGSALLAIAWSRRLSAVVWVPSLAVVLLVLGGFVGATYGTIFNFDSPSQSLTTLWLLALSIAFVALLDGRIGTGRLRESAPVLAIIGVLAYGLAGGKISSGAVALGAVGFVAVVGALRRLAWWRQAAAALAVTVVAFGLGYLLIVSGSADPGGLKLGQLIDRASSVQGLNPVSGSLGIIAGTVILALGISVRWAGLAWFVSDRQRRWEPSTVLGIGLAIGGLGTVLLISGGLNDTWFALAASAPLAVVSAAGAGEASRILGSPGRASWRPLLWAGAAAVFLFAVVLLLWSTGASGGNVWVGTPRWLGPLVGVAGAALAGWLIGRRFGGGRSAGRAWLAATVIVLVLLSAPGRVLGVGSGQVGVQPGLSEEAFTPVGFFTDAIDTTVVREWSDQQVAASDWLKSAAGGGDLLVTNVTFSPFVPALTGLRTLASGILYQAPYGRPGAVQPLLDREAASWAFIDGPTTASVAPLCAAGADWVWVDPTRTAVRDWTPFATTAFQNDQVIVLRLLPEACP